MRPCILLSPVRELRTWRARCGSSTRPLLLLAHGVLSMHRFVGQVHGRCGWNVCHGLTTRTSFPIPWPCTHYPFSSHDPRPFPDEDAGPHSLLSSAGHRPRLVPPAHPLGRSFQTRIVPFQMRPIPPFNRILPKGKRKRASCSCTSRPSHNQRRRSSHAFRRRRLQPRGTMRTRRHRRKAQCKGEHSVETSQERERAGRRATRRRRERWMEGRIQTWCRRMWEPPQ